MAVINSGFDVNTPQSVDLSYGKINNGVIVPYASVAEALLGMVSSYRYIGKTCLITTIDGNSEYWFQAGVTDNDLVIKSNGSGMEEYDY